MLGQPSPPRNGRAVDGVSGIMSNRRGAAALEYNAADGGISERLAMRPRVAFDSRNIWRRLEACQTVARAYGWHPNDIIHFAQEVRAAFSYEDAMAVIERHFDVIKGARRIR
jgi:hypothetical protein